MAPQHNPVTLLKELQEHNAFFDDLVDMFPAKLYVAGNSGDDNYSSKYYKGQSKESKEARRARSKAAKRAKFDPEQSESTRQVKQRLAQEAEQVDEDESAMKVSDNSTPSTPLLVSPSKISPSTNSSPPETSSASRIEALRAKLHAKLAEKRGQRPVDPSVVSKRAARRADKQRRKEEAKRKRSSVVSKNSASSATRYVVDSEVSLDTNADLSADLAQMDFGKLAGLNQTPKSYVNNKSLANLNKKKNLEKMLADAEEKRLRLEELKRGNEEEKLKAQKIVWSNTLKEASGDRVKEDASKIKKVIKRKEAKKKKSAKAWQSRMEQTKEKMDDRQRIRSHNLDKRKQGGALGANLSKKRIADSSDETEKGRSRRLSRAGFEGKKQDFLNQKGSKNTRTNQ